MNKHIGLLIWKEMKKRELSSAALAASLQISKNRMQTILSNPSIDTDMLLRISEALNFDFFQYYDKKKLVSQIEAAAKDNSLQEIERLKGLVREKNVAIDLKDQLIKTQSNMIALLEKGQYR
jgi:plasmid maintenance system antidote protein VapI